MDNEFLIGVNYWPSKQFTAMWKQFDQHIIEADFAQMKSYGIQLIRFFLLWEDFQPDPKHVSQQQLGNLDSLLAIADRLNIKVIPTLFVGHMSGPNWLPGWMMSHQIAVASGLYLFNGQDTGYKPYSFFSHPRMREAQQILIKEVVSQTKQHSCIWAWDISNEPDRLENPSPEVYDTWLKETLTLIRQQDASRPITVGAHIKGLQGSGFLVDSVSRSDIVSVHAYPMYEGKRADDTEYVIQLVQQAQKGHKPVMLAEFGLPTSPKNQQESTQTSWARKMWQQPLVTEHQQADYVIKTIEEAKKTGVKAALIWNWQDYDPSLYTQFPFNQLIHERYFGIIHADGRPKVAAKAIRAQIN